MSEQCVAQLRRRGPYSKSAQTRAKILEAAFKVFAVRGYHAGSVQEVADAVGMSQTSVLHHFKRKSELLLAVLEHRDHHSVQRTEGMHFRDIVMAQVQANVDVAGLTQLYSVLSGESSTQGHPGREYFRRRFTELREEYAQEFAQLASQGLLRPGVDPEQAAASLIALWDGIQLQHLYAPEQIDIASILSTYLDQILIPAQVPLNKK